jgi:predicted lipoprotein with Yx(FWY)xxD motif
MKRLLILLALAVPATALGAATPLVTTFKSPQFGRVLAQTSSGKALYYWTPEKADHKIHCTGACLKAWPPLIVPKGKRIAAHRPGYSGTFGTIVRPDGRTQIAYNRLPLYSYIHDPKGVVLCNNVDGWFVVNA